MTTEEFLKNIQETYRKGVEIISRKNADYAASTDPFKNFKFAEMVGVDPGRAILVRIADKFARISNLMDKAAKVEDEKIEDTILDCINYFAILREYLRDTKK